MKKESNDTFYALLCLVFVMMFCSQAVVRAEEASGETTGDLKIAVATDLHIDPDNHYAGIVNPMVMYNMELIDAFLWDVVQQKADLVILCGDVSNAGATYQHEILAKKLQDTEAQGVPVYVLPGNHDIGSAEEAEEFARVYAAFGFEEAYSKDQDSLSYSILIDDVLILMLDTDGYSKRTSGAYISKVSLRWIRSQLELAKQNGWQVITAGHYPVLTSHTTEFTGREEFVQALEDYQVPVYLCGHLHQRGVMTGPHLTELVVEQLITYPCGYAMLSLDSSRLTYQPQTVDVKTWAAQAEHPIEALEEFDTYGAQIRQEKSEDLIEMLRADHEITEKQQNQAVAFYAQLMEVYASGLLYDSLEKLYAHPGYKVFMELAEGTNYGKWIPVILESASPFAKGFVIENHMVNTID